jgi:two-component system LytT family sensor kinase
VTSTRDDGRPRAWLILAAGTAIGVASGIVATQVLAGELSGARRLALFLSNVAYWSSWSLLALAVIALAWRLPLTGARRWHALALHAGASVVFPFVHVPAFSLLAMLIRRGVLGTPMQPAEIILDPGWLTRWQIEWEVTMYWALVGLTHALKFRAEGRARALQAARLDAELSQARLQALQQQIHPHFLLNTLQSVSVLIHRDRDAAEEMLVCLGELLRGSMRGRSSVLVPLARELEYVRQYLRIEALNIGERLRIEEDIDGNTLDCLVPELVLQPLVENAVRHGIAPSVHGGTVHISARRDQTALALRVRNDAAEAATSTSGSGIALQNTRRRLELLYGDAHTFDISRADGCGLEVRLTLPANTTTAGARS